jgi:hypothetical protein
MSASSCCVTCGMRLHASAHLLRRQRGCASAAGARRAELLELRQRPSGDDARSRGPRGRRRRTSSSVMRPSRRCRGRCAAVRSARAPVAASPSQRGRGVSGRSGRHPLRRERWEGWGGGLRRLAFGGDGAGRALRVNAIEDADRLADQISSPFFTFARQHLRRWEGTSSVALPASISMSVSPS